MPTSVRTSRVCIAAAAIALHGCVGHHDLDSPERVLAQYTSAIADHRYRVAYALLSDRTRARLPYSDFVATLAEDPAATRARLEWLRREPTSSEAEARMVVDDEEVEFARDRGGFRIEGNPVASFDQHSPRAAVRSFVHALETRDAARVLRLAPPSARAALDQADVAAALDSENRGAYEELASSLRAALAVPIAEVGATATMHFAGDRTLRLVRIGELWYVDSID